jgi:hypothetical protein
MEGTVGLLLALLSLLAILTLQVLCFSNLLGRFGCLILAVYTERRQRSTQHPESSGSEYMMSTETTRSL